MAAGLGAESLAAKFMQGGALGTYRGKWLLVEAADTATEDGLAKNHGILLPPGYLGQAAAYGQHQKKPVPGREEGQQL